MKLKIIIAAAALAIAALGSAQGGGMRMMMGGGGGSPTMLLFSGGGFGRGGGGGGAQVREDVAKEIKLSDEQKTKLLAIQDGQREKMMAMFQGGGGGGDREAMMKTVQEMLAAAEKEVNGVLKDEQKKRLRELWVQRQGNGAIANPEVQKELGLSDDQKAKIKSLQDKQQEAMMALFEKMRNGEIEREQMQEAQTNNRKIMNDELGKILTADQAAKLKAMGGAAFKFDEGN